MNISKIWKNNRRFIIFLVGMLFFRSAIADWYQVPTGSMEPNILIGDRVWVNKLAYDHKVPFTTVNLSRHSEPKRGEIVVFYSEAADKRLIKRVIGVPGDVISMHRNRLTINGVPTKLTPTSDNELTLDNQAQNTLILFEALPESGRANDHQIKLHLDAFSQLAFFSPQVVSDDHLWVMGDNRDNSADSRVIGLVPRSELIGRAEKVILSLDKNDYYLPRESRYLVDL
jgi:signal peptidase I